MAKYLGRYSNQTIDTIEKYCHGVQVNLLDQVNIIIESELTKCKDHSSEYELKLFVHSLKKRLDQIKLL